IKPVAKFYLANHQRIEIEGVKGNVVVKEMSGAGKSGFAGAGTFSPPSRGRLDDVTVNLYDDSHGPDPKPALTMKTNNAVFDNETFIVFTEGYREADGTEIAGDQVPVTMTGRIELKGRGLKIRWNDNDGRLELLEIAHGQLLIVKPDAMSKEKKAKPNRQTVRRWPEGPLPFMLAARDQKSAGEVITSYRPPASQPKAAKARTGSGAAGPVTYRANFLDNIRINQLDPSGTFDQLVIDNVDRMNIDFQMKQSAPEGAAAHASDPASSQTPTAGPPNPTTNEAATKPSAAGANPSTGKAPDTKPADDDSGQQPVYIRWTGMLRITPIESAPYVPLKPGDSAVKMIGQPVRIRRVEAKQQGAQDIRSSTVLYGSAGDNVWLDSSPAFPQILIDRTPDPSAADQRVTHLVSMGQVQYSGGAHLARMTGPGNADIPLEGEAGNQPALHAAWSKLAEFDFSGIDAQGQPVIRTGQFRGDVDIEHPRLNLRSQLLDLHFATSIKPPVPGAKLTRQQQQAKPQSQTNLESVIATTGVNCELMDADGKKSTIDADRLVLETAMASDRLYPRHILGTGSVHARTTDDDLKADMLDVLLRPSIPVAKGAKAAKVKNATESQNAQVDLEEMVSTGHVIARSKDGSTAMGDRLVVNGAPGKTHAILTSAVRSKVIGPKGDFVVGPQIEFNTGEGRAYIVGPGELYAMRQESTTQPAEPIRVNWATGAQFDGALNRIDADGSINAESTDRRGFVNTATGDHIRIDLKNKPPVVTTRPVLASAPQKKASPAKNDSLTGGVKMDLFKDKDVVAMTLDRNADMKSTLSSDGKILQQMVLEGPRIIVQVLAPDGTKSMMVTVPAAGKMLVRDYRPVQSAPGAKSASSADLGGQGTTAFAWQKSMIYSDAAHRADMDGTVRIVHMDEDTGKGEAIAPVVMTAEHVTALFEPSPEKKPASAANPKTAVATSAPAPAEDSHIQLKYVTALASDTEFVVVKRGDDLMQAREIDYDPARKALIAIGTQRNPVNFMNLGTIKTLADRMEWDTVTWKTTVTNANVDFRPVQPVVQPPKVNKPKPQPIRPGDRSIR
ncbi:MAG TPA: hypothetical protein VIM11_12785, partial [Tepidisphaeraceae bacterium]